MIVFMDGDTESVPKAEVVFETKMRIYMGETDKLPFDFLSKYALSATNHGMIIGKNKFPDQVRELCLNNLDIQVKINGGWLLKTVDKEYVMKELQK
jgi:hypothetical protein